MSYAVIKDWFDAGLDGLSGPPVVSRKNPFQNNNARPNVLASSKGDTTGAGTACPPGLKQIGNGVCGPACTPPYSWDGMGCSILSTGGGMTTQEQPASSPAVEEIGAPEEGSWPSGGGAGAAAGRRSDSRTRSGGAGGKLPGSGGGSGFGPKKGTVPGGGGGGGSSGGSLPAPPAPVVGPSGKSGVRAGAASSSGASPAPFSRAGIQNRLYQMLAPSAPTPTPLSPDPGYGPWQTQHAYQAAESAFAAQAAAAMQPGSNITVVTHVPPPATPMTGPAAPALATPSYVATGPKPDGLLLQSAVVAAEDKPFPWLLVVGAVVVGGGLYYTQKGKRGRR